MEIKNFSDLEEKIFRKGLPKEMAAEVQAAVDGGQTEIACKHMTTIENDQVGFRAHFRYDVEAQHAYLNHIQAAIFRSRDFNGVREHTFHDYQLITAMEAYRLLKYGELVAVNKTLRNKNGEQYNAWISLNLTGTKDDKGSYPLKSYHQNYYGEQPFLIRDALTQLKTPIKELEMQAGIEKLEKLLSKAILPAVTIMHNGQEQKGYLSIDPGNAGARLYDAHMKLVDAYARPRPEQKQRRSETVTPAKESKQTEQEPVKKKPGKQSQKQGVNWSSQQRKGPTR